VENKLPGVWANWKITDKNLISPTGRSYKPEDIEPEFYTQSDLAKALGVTRGAIADRIRRGTLPPFDKDKVWRRETIQYLLS
jgi:hypothetical protein